MCNIILVGSVRRQKVLKMKLGFKSARQEEETGGVGVYEAGKISDAVVVQVEASSTECHVQSKPPLINMRGFTREKVPQWSE
jgi:hypothetical protein